MLYIEAVYNSYYSPSISGETFKPWETSSISSIVYDSLFIARCRLRAATSSLRTAVSSSLCLLLAARLALRALIAFFSLAFYEAFYSFCSYVARTRRALVTLSSVYIIIASRASVTVMLSPLVA